jgi:hypothetical protein
MTYRNDKVSPLGQEDLTLEKVDSIIYGASEPPASGRVVGKPIDIMQIWPDVTQPRRVIPAAIRGRWDGNPAEIKGMLVKWQNKIAAMLKPEEQFYAQPILKKEAEIKINLDEQPRIIQSFVELIDLAENIYEKGLNLPITVSKVAAERYLLHTGERRLVAHHLLNAVFGTHDKIAAIEREHDVFSQVAENTQRSGMNAISMARSLAKLIMATRADEMDFMPYAEMLTELGCDRPFYAQVANVNTKRGMSDSVKNALNVSSDSWVSRYKALLSLPDDIWMIADEHDWAEFRLRALLQLPETLQFTAAENQWNTDQIQAALDRQSPSKIRDNFPVGKLSSPGTPYAPLRSGFGRVESNFDDEDDTPPIRTRMGEVMGLYETPPPSPLPVDREGESARPIITYLSTDAEWRAAGYQYCPHPDEMGPGEQWDDADEAMAHEAALMAAEIDANSLVQDNTPLVLEYEVQLLVDGLVSVAKAMDDNKAAQMLTNLRRRGREDIRLWMLANNQDANTYQKKLEAEGEQVAYFLDVVKEKMWDFLANIHAVAHEVWEGM